MLRGAGSIPAGVFSGLVWLLRGLSACSLIIPYRSIIKAAAGLPGALFVLLFLGAFMAFLRGVYAFAGVCSCKL